MKPSFTSYAAKMRQTHREAVATVIALIVIVAVWFIGGIGLSGCDIEVFSTPLWIIGGTVGPWVAAIICAVVLAKCVFADFGLDEPEEAEDGEVHRG